VTKTRKNSIWLALSIWCTGLLCIVGLDYFLRINSTEYYSLGMGENIWFLSHSLLGLIAFVILNFTFKPLDKINRIKGLLIACTFGVAWYLVVIYVYVLGSGVDSL